MNPINKSTAKGSCDFWFTDVDLIRFLAGTIFDGGYSSLYPLFSLFTALIYPASSRVILPVHFSESMKAIYRCMGMSYLNLGMYIRPVYSAFRVRG